MEFKKLKTEGLTTLADLVRREATDRDPLLAAALQRIEVVQDGRHGQGRSDIRLTIAIGKGVEAVVQDRYDDQDASASTLMASVGRLVDAAVSVFDDRHHTIEMLREVRGALSREVSKARRRGLPYRTLDVALTPSDAGSGDLPAVAVGIEAIGPMLDMERTALIFESAADVVERFAEMREKQEQRHAIRDQVVSAGADVMIDSVTLAALEDGGVDPAAAVSTYEPATFRSSIWTCGTAALCSTFAMAS